MIYTYLSVLATAGLVLVAMRHRDHALGRALAAAGLTANLDALATKLDTHMISLSCRECGRRADPPVPHVDAPPLPMAETVLIGRESGFVVTAVCAACSAPLMSRVLSVVEADQLRRMGAVDADALVDAFRIELEKH